MKRFIALILAVLVFVPALAMTGCEDPLAKLGEDLDAAYAKMGDTYYWAYYWANLAGQVGTDDTAESELQAKFDSWKQYIKDAGDVVDLWLDLNEDELNSYISEWTNTAAEMQAVVDEYEVPGETEDLSQVTVAE